MSLLTHISLRYLNLFAVLALSLSFGFAVAPHRDDGAPDEDKDKGKPNRKSDKPKRKPKRKEQGERR